MAQIKENFFDRDYYVRGDVDNPTPALIILEKAPLLRGFSF
tara:strand:- start:1082 stop:1204 length:123 start_codon:yes stop_codon:yes gene_type:complete